MYNFYQLSAFAPLVEPTRLHTVTSLPAMPYCESDFTKADILQLPLSMKLCVNTLKT